MSERFSTEVFRKIWNDDRGDYMTIGPDRDGLGLVELVDNETHKSITFTAAQATLIAEALRLCVREILSEEAASAGDGPRATISHGRKKNPTRPAHVCEIMEAIIREARRPMTRGEIVSAFEKRHVPIPFEDKARYIGTIAWRHKGLFINIEGRGYWLREESVPPEAPLPFAIAMESGVGIISSSEDRGKGEQT